MDPTRLARKIASSATMIALLAAASIVYSYHERNYDKAYAPLMKYGSVGQTVDAGPFSVKVDKVTVAKSVVETEFEGYAAPLRTAPSTIFVLVDGRVTATRDGMELSHVILRNSAGTQFEPSGKGTSDKFTDSTVQPGYWISGAWLFEIPRSALPGVHLQVANQTEVDVPHQTFPHLGFEFNPGADVDLGIDGGNAASLIAHAKEKAPYREPQE